MIKEVRLPEISENVNTGDVIKVLVSVGDSVEVDQPLVELETEKAVFEVPSTEAGVISEILVSAGDTIEVNQAIVKIDTAGTAAGAAKTEVKKARKDRRKRKKKTAKEPEPAAVSEASSPTAAQEPAPPSRPAEAVSSPAMTVGTARDPAPASPSLRRLARELGVDISQVHGSGPGGRILRDDLTNYARNVVAGASATVPKSSATDVTENTKWGPIVREPMSKIRQVTARTMGQAWTTIPHVTQYDKVDITEMEEIRKQYSKRMEETGGKLTMTAILLKVAASALKVYPQFNASVDLEQQQIVYRRYYHIGVAVDTDRGLLVPVIRAVDKKNITELSLELNKAAERARNKKLTPDEMEGGTFTISNLGGIGGTNFSPIIYPPQVAILGVARARIEPVWVADKFEPRMILPLSVSYDHRIIDGADAARFLRWIVQALEEPLLLALEG